MEESQKQGLRDGNWVLLRVHRGDGSAEGRGKSDLIMFADDGVRA